MPISALEALRSATEDPFYSLNFGLTHPGLSAGAAQSITEDLGKNRVKRALFAHTWHNYGSPSAKCLNRHVGAPLRAVLSIPANCVRVPAQALYEVRSALGEARILAPVRVALDLAQVSLQIAANVVAFPAHLAQTGVCILGALTGLAGGAIACAFTGWHARKDWQLSQQKSRAATTLQTAEAELVAVWNLLDAASYVDDIDLPEQAQRLKAIEKVLDSTQAQIDREPHHAAREQRLGRCWMGHYVYPERVDSVRLDLDSARSTLAEAMSALERFEAAA